MADLATHLCTALLPAALLDARRIGPLVLGVALPDLGARVIPMALEALALRGAPIPEAVILPWGVLHEPLPLALTALTLAGAIALDERWEFLRGATLGCGLHLGVDVLQDHHGYGYYLCAPLGLGRYELGWIGSEATVPLAPWLIALTAAAWGWRWRRRGRPDRPA